MRCYNLNQPFHTDTLRKHVRPTSATIAPLDKERDRLPNGKQVYGLTLTYNIKIENNNTSLVPDIPVVTDQLYEHYLSGVFGISKFVFGSVALRAIIYTSVYSIRRQSKGA